MGRRFGVAGDAEGFERGAPVVRLAERRKMTPPDLAQMRAYWEALRVDGALPARAAVDPRGIADLLDRCLLAERIAPGMARLRLAGMALCDLLGMDLRGMPISALILPEARPAFAAALDRVFTGRCIVDLDLVTERSLLRPALSARLLLLPLTGRDGQPDRAIGAMVLDGAPGRTPRRFAVAALRETAIEGLPPGARALPARPTLPGNPSIAPGPATTEPATTELARGFAEAPQPFAARPAATGTAAAVPYLRLVTGRD